MAGRKHDFPLIARIVEENMDHEIHLMNKIGRHELRLRLNDQRGHLFDGIKAIQEKLIQIDAVDDSINEADRKENSHELQEYRDQQKAWESTVKEGRQAIQFNGPVGQVVVQQ